MNICEYDVMNYIIKEGYTSQHIIAEVTNYPLGKVNEAIRELTKERYLNAQSLLTEKAYEEMEFKKPENAIILAAGLGMRMVPINTCEQLRELDDNSSNLDSDIISVIVDEMGIERKDIQDIFNLNKGMTNRSFRFRINDKQYIMRIPGEGTDGLVDRKNEYEVYQSIKESKICDDVIYMSAENGYKITGFLDNVRECDPFNREDVKLCMQKLRSFHDKKLKVPHTFDVYEKIDLYESLWEGKPSIFTDYLETKEKIIELKPIIESLPKEWALTHIDAVHDNFLFADNEIRLIDWEYAGMQDPHLDVAMFAIYAMYDREHVEMLIGSYFVEGCSSDIRMKIYCYIATGGLLWSNWCEYKRFCGVEFGDYSLRQYRYAKDYYSIVMKEFVNNKT